MLNIVSTVSNKKYNLLKLIALIVLPALTFLCLSVGQFWHVAGTTQIAEMIILFDIVLGILLQISAKQYDTREDLHDGTLALTGIDEDTGMPKLTLTITKDPNELIKATTVRLKTKRVVPILANRE